MNALAIVERHRRKPRFSWARLLHGRINSNLQTYVRGVDTDRISTSDDGLLRWLIASAYARTAGLFAKTPPSQNSSITPLVGAVIRCTGKYTGAAALAMATSAMR